MSDGIGTYTVCGHYNPYAGRATACSGNVFQVYTKLKPRVGYPLDETEQDGGTVCEGHMSSFEELAQRPAENRGFEIVRRELVGSIVTPEGGALAGKEIE